MDYRITFDEICQQLCSIYRVTLCSFQNDVDNQIENVGYTKSGKGVSVAMGDSASVDSMQRTGIDQISTTTPSPTILK